MMTIEEYHLYANDVLRKATGANIHAIKNKLNSIHGFALLLVDRPHKRDEYLAYIADSKMAIHKIIYP